jgi:hypothetical protein
MPPRPPAVQVKNIRATLVLRAEKIFLRGFAPGPSQKGREEIEEVKI